MFGELEAIRSKSVGDHQLRASLDIRTMDLRDSRWVGEIEFIETFVESNPACVQHGSHRAISEDGLGGEKV